MGMSSREIEVWHCHMGSSAPAWEWEDGHHGEVTPGEIQHAEGVRRREGGEPIDPCVPVVLFLIVKEDVEDVDGGDAELLNAARHLVGDYSADHVGVFPVPAVPEELVDGRWSSCCRGRWTRHAR
jgi:hypothetical protein